MDGRVNILDLLLVETDMCLTPGQNTGNPRTDVNQDLLVDAMDWWQVYDMQGWPY